jgi:hypothetical protein
LCFRGVGLKRYGRRNVRPLTAVGVFILLLYVSMDLTDVSQQVQERAWEQLYQTGSGFDHVTGKGVIRNGSKVINEVIMAILVCARRE